MIPKLKDLTEPGIGLFLVETGYPEHWWYRADDGLWYCGCEDNVAWTWREIIYDIGGDSTNYRVE